MVIFSTFPTVHTDLGFGDLTEKLFIVTRVPKINCFKISAYSSCKNEQLDKKRSDFRQVLDYMPQSGHCLHRPLGCKKGLMTLKVCWYEIADEYEGVQKRGWIGERVGDK